MEKIRVNSYLKESYIFPVQKFTSLVDVDMKNKVSSVEVFIHGKLNFSKEIPFTPVTHWSEERIAIMVSLIAIEDYCPMATIITFDAEGNLSYEDIKPRHAFKSRIWDCRYCRKEMLI